MRKLYRLFASAAFLLCCMATISANVLNINGVDQLVDTIIPKHQVGPGTTYAFYHCPNRPLTIHVLEVDLSNPYIQVETCNGGQKAVAVETTTNMFLRNDSQGHDMVAAHNGAFYHTSETDATAAGMSRMGLISKGECLLNPVSLPIFVLTDDKVPYLEQVDFNATLTAGEASTRIHTLNTHFLEFDTSDDSGERMMLYTNAYGTATNSLDAGTMVTITPKSGEFFFAANATVQCIVESIGDHSGSASIPSGKALLHGTGANATFLKALTPGQECTITLSSTMPGYPSVTNIKEGLGGSGHSVLRDGNVVISGNPDIHPRTFMGISKDGKTIYSVAVDGRWNGSAGVDLDDEGRILKWLGAWHGLNLDGGGSTTMVVNAEIKNHPSGGAERAVGDALLFYSNAPVDDNIGQIAFEARQYNVPITARFRPAIYGYNQYGLLKTKDLQGVKITCDPQVGTINENNEFIAVETVESGYIYAEYNGITTKQFVRTIHSPLSLVYDNYIVDNRKGYPVQMNAQIGNFTYDVDAASVEWTIADESVCSMNDGKVTGIKNGKTQLTGASTNFSGNVNITVEIPETDALTLLPEYTDTTWTTTKSGAKDLTLTPDGEGLKINFTGASTRSAYITLAADSISTYSLPHSFSLAINPGDITINKIQLALINNLGERATAIISETPLALNQVTVINNPISNQWDSNNNAIYPIRISNIRMDMAKPTAGNSYEIAISKLEQLYGDPVGIEDVIAQRKNIEIYPNPVHAGQQVYINLDSPASIKIFSLGGKLVKAIETQGTCCFDTAGMPAGMYIMKVTTDENSSSAKLIIK